MESIRSVGGVGGKLKLRSSAESELKQQEREAKRVLASQRGALGGGRGRGRGNQPDMMRDLSAQLKLRGGPRPGQLLRRGKR